jgi:hypothetical protein
MYIAAVELSKQNGWGVMCSHRSGETEDTTIAGLAVGLATGQFKTSAPCGRGEWMAKYNQLLLEEEQTSAARQSSRARASERPTGWAPERSITITVCVLLCLRDSKITFHPWICTRYGRVHNHIMYVP